MTEGKLRRIKTGPLERRLSLMLSGARAGTALLGNRASSWWMEKEKKKAHQNAALRKQAEKYANTLGRLKGSYVKIGQMLALFGDHILPEELTDALHKLEHQTHPLEWKALKQTVEDNLGDRAAELAIDPEPLAAASLGQVHKAVIKQTGEELCLKIQYPGIRQSIDSDFNDVIRLLKLGHWLEGGRDMRDWLEELRRLLKAEVDYAREADQTEAMALRLSGNPTYRVPRVYRQYSTDSVLALEYLAGFEVSHTAVRQLALSQRSLLGEAMLELFFMEVFEWGVMQTDPNFGNYRIQPGEANQPPRLILLDFGAVRTYSDEFLAPFRQVIAGAFFNDNARIISGLIALGCLQPDAPEPARAAFTEVCKAMLEPMRQSLRGVPDYALNDLGQYRWRESKLLKRVGKLAAKSAFSKHFTLPSREFVSIARKLTGVFSFIAALGAEFNGYPVIEKYLEVP